MTRNNILNLLALGTLLLAGGSIPLPAQAPTAHDPTFAGQVAALSEPGGFFDTDNLISNERSFLEVVPELRRLGLRGGAYIGVGPDQNFSYIAVVRPDVAFIIDIRRDNLLLHLLFKSLFAVARTRVEYLAMLVGRPVPADLGAWRDAGIDRIVKQVEAEPLDPKGVTALRARLEAAVTRIGVTLTREDLTTIDRFHRRFIEAGTGLRFHTMGRPPQAYYPTYRELLLMTDPLGNYGHYLASEESFQFVKTLQQQDLVIPVVGDLSGPRALAAIAALMSRRGQRLSALYASNVEYYLFGDPRFGAYIENLRRLPRTERSVIIRSFFGRYGPGGGSASRLQPVNDLVGGFPKGKYRYYEDLIGK
jgi:hypothetical protein